MILKSVEIKNYKSVRQCTIEMKEVAGANTICLFGVNESGKSSILKAIALLDDENVEYPDDYYNQDDAIEIEFNYQIEPKDLKEFKTLLSKEESIPKEFIKALSLNRYYISVNFEPNEETDKLVFHDIDFLDTNVDDWKIEDGNFVRAAIVAFEEQDEIREFLGQYLEIFFTKVHTTVFWEASEAYLLRDEIDLLKFSENPVGVSIPLMNCFKLAGIASDEIKDVVDSLKRSTQKKNLETRLSEAVTLHLKSVWKKHKVNILFNIDGNLISTLVEDHNVRHKAKTTDQRSDGFRKFISFILTASAEYAGGIFSNKILLLDEPETHLHPQAQMDMLLELLKISSRNGNFVVLATHSVFLVDRMNLERNIQVVKDGDATTIHGLESGISSYAEVIYEVFGVPTNDYHNELYGFLETCESPNFKSLKKSKTWIRLKPDGSDEPIKVSMPEYIRNSIHHPENTLNKPVTLIQLKTSIDLLGGLKKQMK